MKMEGPTWDVMICRHEATIQFARTVLAFAGEVLTGNATVEDIKGKRVLGVLPMHLAMHADCVSEIVLDPPPRGAELDLGGVLDRFKGIRTFAVAEIASLSRPRADFLIEGEAVDKVLGQMEGQS